MCEHMFGQVISATEVSATMLTLELADLQMHVADMLLQMAEFFEEQLALWAAMGPILESKGQRLNREKRVGDFSDYIRQ